MWKGPTEWQKLRFAILKRDKFRCQYCGAKGRHVRLHVDHIIPRSRGGTDHPGNLVAACKDCNEGKAANFLSHEQMLRMRQSIRTRHSRNIKLALKKQREEFFAAIRAGKLARTDAITRELERQLDESLPWRKAQREQEELDQMFADKMAADD